MVDYAPYSRLGPVKIFIRNAAVAIDQVYYKIQDTDVLHAKYLYILANDVAGEIVEVEDNVTEFKPGQRVLT